MLDASDRPYSSEQPKTRRGVPYQEFKVPRYRRGKMLLHRNGSPVMRPIIKEGADGNGVTLHYRCGFCSEPFRSRRQRTRHTSVCVEV